MTRKKKSAEQDYRYFTDMDQKMEFRRKGMEWPEFRPMHIASPTSVLEVYANTELAIQHGAWCPVPDHLMQYVPEF